MTVMMDFELLISIRQYGLLSTLEILSNKSYQLQEGLPGTKKYVVSFYYRHVGGMRVFHFINIATRARNAVKQALCIINSGYSIHMDHANSYIILQYVILFRI